MTQRFSRMHRTRFSRAQVVAICALATGPKTARQIAGVRGAGWGRSPSRCAGPSPTPAPPPPATPTIRAEAVCTLIDQGNTAPAHQKRNRK